MRSAKLFLASPLKMTDDRQQVELLVRRKNDEWTRSGWRLEFASSDAGTASTYLTRGQDNLNAAIEAADLFVLLFSTRLGIGSFTVEEFEVAVAHARSAKRPKILVCWNDESVRVGGLDYSGLANVMSFVKRLHELEVYYKKYENVHELVSFLDKEFDNVWSSLATRLETLEDITALTLDIDEELLEAVRGMSLVSPARKARAYGAIVRDALSARGLLCSGFLNGRLPEAAKSVLAAALQSVELRIDASRELDAITYKAHEFELRVLQPVLMWHCSCGALAEGGASTARQPGCAIHDSPHGDALTRLYKSSLICTSFEGVDVLWRRSPEMWPPTIDSFDLCRDIEQDGALARPVRTVLDLGCGTGMLGLFVGMHNPGVRRIYLADWLLTPLAYAWLSTNLNAPKLRGKTVTCLLGMQTNWLECPEAVAPVDLCVCNPPYLPIFEDFPQMRLAHTVAGTDLLEHVVERASDIAARTYISFSDVAADEAKRAAARRNRVLRKIGDGHTIPFTVPQAFQSLDYVEKLCREKKIVERNHRGFRWWHTINTYCIEGN